MLTINPKEIKQSEVQKWLTGGVAPRPIALVSTISIDGIRNLSPFSFFNSFGSNPPVVAFSPSRRGKDNTVKDTYNNLVETGECVIHAVTIDIVQQMNLASAEVPSDVDEFYLAGFTPVESQMVRPFRVKESPFAMECKVIQIIELGGSNGSGNLAICEVLLFHIDENVITNNSIDPFKIRHTARNSGNWYTIADKNSMYELPKPKFDNPIGYYGLPAFIKNSKILTANHIARLAHVDKLPSIAEVEESCNNMISGDYSLLQMEFKDIISAGKPVTINECEQIIKSALDSNDLDFALKAMVYAGKFI
ncbi:flavin reductase family protein [Candidatus Kapaibacterium sp.]